MTANMDNSTGKSQRILLAEDSITYQRLAVGLLEKLGHTVVVAENGAEVLELLDRDSDFDLVLMDVLMPLMDGLEATREIRRREQSNAQHMPIIAVTGNTASDDRNDCFAAGMDDFVLKPIRLSDIQLAIVRAAQFRNSRSDTSAASDQWSADEGESKNLCRHYAVAIKAVAGDKLLLRQVVLASLDEFPEQLAIMSSSLNAGKFEELRRAAHTMKGTLRLFDARQLSALAMQLSTANDESDVNVLHETLSKLNAEFDLLRPQLKYLASWITEELEKEHPPQNSDFQVYADDNFKKSGSS